MEDELFRRVVYDADNAVHRETHQVPTSAVRQAHRDLFLAFVEEVEALFPATEREYRYPSGSHRARTNMVDRLYLSGSRSARADRDPTGILSTVGMPGLGIVDPLHATRGFLWYNVWPYRFASAATFHQALIPLPIGSDGGWGTGALSRGIATVCMHAVATACGTMCPAHWCILFWTR